MADRNSGVRRAGVAAYTRHVLSALGWAATMGMIDRVPRCTLPRVAKRKLMRGRPITTEEFERILSKVEAVLANPHPNYKPRRVTTSTVNQTEREKRVRKMADVAKTEAPEWERFLRGLWLSGLRLGEALRLSWDSPPLRVDLDGRRPRIVAFAEGHKGRYDELVPITPDFYSLLLETPKDQRRGRVFKVPRKVSYVGPTITAMAVAANVVVNDAGKNASAHDFRRSFGTRWAMRVHPVVLQRLMRHKAIETTMRYYVDIDADELSDKLWEVDGSGKSPVAVV